MERVKVQGVTGKFSGNIFLSFADVKDDTFEQMRKGICSEIKSVYNRHDFLTDSDIMNKSEKEMFNKISEDMNNSTAALSLKRLSEYLYRYYGRKVIIILDEYDTPMQEAYIKC